MEINGTITPLTLIDEEDGNGTYTINLCFLHNATITVTLDETERLFASLILFAIILIGSLANPIMIVCICRIWSSNHSMSRDLLHLTIGDMIRVYFCLPVRFAAYYDHISHNMLFQSRMFLDIFTEILQLQVLLIISRDRYHAVAKPFEKHNKQNAKSICVLVYSWGCAFFGAGCTSYFYEDYIRLKNECETETQLFAFVLLFLIYESIIVSGIIQFYLRTIHFLLKQGKKMHVLRHTVHPFVPHSEVKDKSDPTCNVVRFESITEEKKKMADNAVHSQIVDSAVPDFKYPETKTAQSEIQTEIKIDSNVSKGLSDSASVMQTSAALVPSNLSEDVNERTTKLRQSDIVADAAEFLGNSQKDDVTKRLDIVINCTFNGIATKTKIVDGQNSSIVKPNKQLPSFSRANEIVQTKVKTVANPEAVGESVETETSGDRPQFSSGNDRDFAQNAIRAEKIFVISQQVEFTVKSVQTLSVGLKEGANIQSSCSGSKDKTESSIQLEKGFEILTKEDNKEERTKKDSLPNIKIEIPGQIKVDEQTENKKKPTFKENIEEREMNANMKLADNSVKLADNNLSSTTKRDASSENEATGMFQMINNKGTIINAAGPFCPMPKRSKVKQRFHKEVQVTQRIAVLIIFLILCWIPLYSARFLQIFFLKSENCCLHKHYKLVWWESLSASTSAINPCLYGILNIQLRNEFWRLTRRFKNFLTNCHCCR